MINQIGRYLQAPESYLSRTWQSFQENPIDSKIRQIAKIAFAGIYHVSLPFVWPMAILGKFLSGDQIPPAADPIPSELLVTPEPLSEVIPTQDVSETNPVSKWEVQFNCDPDAIKIIPLPITVPNNLESDLSYLEGQCLQRANGEGERKRIRHMFEFTRRSDSVARENACVYFKAIEQKIQNKDPKLTEEDLNAFFLELIAGSDKCEPTWYLAAEKVESGSHDQNLLRLVQEYKEHLFMDATILPEQLKNADWNIINCARLLFGEYYGLQSAENSMMDVGYMLEDDQGNRQCPLEIMRADAINIEMRMREKLEDTQPFIEWIKNKVNSERPHDYYDFIHGLIQKYNLPIGAEKFFDENDYSLTAEGAILMLVDIGVLEKKEQV